MATSATPERHLWTHCTFPQQLTAPVEQQIEPIRIEDDQGNRLASRNPYAKIDTDSAGLKFRNYVVSWDKDVLRCFYQGNEVLTMTNLNRYFSTPMRQNFSEHSHYNSLSANFIITDILATSSFDPQNECGDVGRFFCFNRLCCLFWLGNNLTSKWGFQEESQTV